MLATLSVAALVLLAAQAVLVALARVIVPARNVYVTIILVSVLTAPVAFIAAPVLLGGGVTTAGRWFLTLIHLTLGGFFFHFMTLPDRSVTLRILVELLRAPGQSLSTAALGRRYGVATMITSRLEQLAGARCLEISADGRIALTGKGRSFGRFVTAGRSLFGIGSAN
jgi:hypothetical protein